MQDFIRFVITFGASMDNQNKKKGWYGQKKYGVGKGGKLLKNE